MKWTLINQSNLKVALANYEKTWGKGRVDFSRLEPFLSPNNWKTLKYFCTENMSPKVAIRCGLDSAICPLCNGKFVGESNGRLRAVCKLCINKPASKEFISKRVKDTLVETFGSLENAKEEMQRRRENTNIRLFGNKHSFASDQIKSKIRSTLWERYEVINPSHYPEFQSKKKITNAIKTPEERKAIEDKKIATLQLKHGMHVTNLSHVPKFQRKKVRTSLKKYGKRHHLQNTEILAKAMLSANRLYEVKTLHKTYFVQGYERYVISYLEKKYTKVVAQFEPDFKNVILLDKRYEYRPDLYLPDQKVYIEVKSTWTLFEKEKSFAGAQRKARMAYEAGYTLCIFLVLNSKSMKVLPQKWFDLSMPQLKKLIETLKVVELDQSSVYFDKASYADETKIYDSCNFSKKRLPSLSGRS